MTSIRLWFACLLVLIGSAVARAAEPVEVVDDVPAGLPKVANVRAITAGPKHHFVGYYGITPWSSDGSRLFCIEANFGDRLVEAADKAGICLVDPATSALTRVAETSAWNLQQGAMLHWLPGGTGRDLVFNDRVNGRLVSVILNVDTNKRRVIDRPVAAVAPDGKTAIGLNYDRLRRIRPVTGYAGGDASVPLVNRPADDGLFLIDMSTGASRLLVSVEQCCRQLEPPAGVKDRPFWLEHAMFSRDGSRVFLIARASDPASGQLVSAPFIMSADGMNLTALMPWRIQGASHYDWLDGRRLVVTREHAPGKWNHLLIDTTLKEGPKVLAPDVLTRDGHCSFSPDGRWMITDTYPDAERRQHLFVLDVHSGRAARIASFYQPAQYRGDWRCDLHPRWSRDSRQICIDSTHDGVRQVYVLELKTPS
jgi:hypothetical protein